MSTSGGYPSVERETTKFDDWPLELGPQKNNATIDSKCMDIV